jgi:hypothetical protein
MTGATHVSLYHGPDSRVTVHQHDAAGDAPILSISSPTSHVTFSAMQRDGLTTADVAFTHDLAAGAIAYAAAVEAMHAVHQQRRTDRAETSTPLRAEAPA